MVLTITHDAMQEPRPILPTYRCGNTYTPPWSTVTRPLHFRYVRYTPSNTQALDILAFWGRGVKRLVLTPPPLPLLWTPPQLHAYQEIH